MKTLCDKRRGEEFLFDLASSSALASSAVQIVPVLQCEQQRGGMHEWSDQHTHRLSTRISSNR